MNRKLIYIFPLVLSLTLLALPSFTFAINSNVWNPSILQGPLVTCWGGPVNGDGSTNANACTSLCDLVATVANVIYFFIGVVIWIITPILVAWAGVLFMLSGGSPEKASSARKMITGVAIGLLIVLCAYLIVSVFVGVLGSGNSFGNLIGGFGGNAACTITP